MRLYFMAFLVFTSTVYAGGQKPPQITVRLHAEGNPNDGPSFVSQVKLFYPAKDIYIDTVPIVSEKDFREFVAFPASTGNGTFGAYFILDSHGRDKLYQFSIEKKGGLGVVLINGRVASAMQVDKTVTDGVFFVPSGFTADEILTLEALYPIIGKESEFSKKKKTHPPKVQNKPVVTPTPAPLPQ